MSLFAQTASEKTIIALPTLASPTQSAPAPPAPTSSNPNVSALHRPEEGFSIALPGQFFIMESPEGAYLLNSRFTPGLVIVRSLPSLTEEGISRAIRHDWKDDTITVRFTAPPEALAVSGGRGWIVPIAGTSLADGYEIEGAMLACLGPKGGGMIAMGIAPTEAWKKLGPVFGQIGRSVRMTEWVPGPIADKAKAQLNGKLLEEEGTLIQLEFHTDGALRETTSAGNRMGFWSVRTKDDEARVILQWDDCSATAESFFTAEDGAFVLDGKRYRVSAITKAGSR